jgi:hypothetical protein
MKRPAALEGKYAWRAGLATTTTVRACGERPGSHVNVVTVNDAGESLLIRRADNDS